MPPVSLSRDQQRFRTTRALQPSHATVDMPSAFQRAFTLLQESPASRRRLIFCQISPGMAGKSSILSQLSVIPENVTLHFIRLEGHSAMRTS